MDLKRINILVESFRKDTIGAPRWAERSNAFEYPNQSIEIVVVLKLIRATQGLSALQLLCNAGLFIDMGSSLRGVNDCVEEVYFLLESYPGRTSGHVEQFVKNFFEGTVDGFLDSTTHQVQREKIRAACVRVLKGRHDDTTQKMLERIYRAFSGYIHAGYSNVMEVYNGAQDCFNLSGVPSEVVRKSWQEHFNLACNAVLMASAFAAQKFGKQSYCDAMMKDIR